LVGSTTFEQNLGEVVCKPAVFGDNISRCGKPKSETTVIYLTKESNLDEFPNIYDAASGELEPGLRLPPSQDELRDILAEGRG
jgi:hypothetical protein